MSSGVQRLCNTMSVATYAEGMALITAAIGTPEQNPEMWHKIAKPVANWRQDDISIHSQKDTEHMSGDSMVDQSNTWWSAVQSAVCENQP